MTIGRIAHSHHWDIERLADLNQAIGAAAFMPYRWTINEAKLAALLRCADVAHIDHRRAPSLLYSITRPDTVSDAHWRFQNKINKPAVEKDKLTYTSGSPFGLEEAEAWWLCYDTIVLVNSEIVRSNGLMQDIGIANGFAIRRVAGAESPRLLSKLVGTAGLAPVNAEIKVTDPVSLASTLGGKNLYGDDPIAPVRELLQNAVDAVRARRAYQSRSAGWGSVRIQIVPDLTETDTLWLMVDDDGIGMSERVLTGPLLDFGRSFWTSSTLREEFPGLASRVSPIGKFGIGFFSVFVLGDHVKVISRRFDAGAADTKVLQFFSIDRRPIVRSAASDELPVDYSTRIAIKLTHPAFSHDKKSTHQRGPSFADRIRHLVCAVDVRIEFLDSIAGTSFVHEPEWTATSSEVFLDELLAFLPAKDRRDLVERHKHQLTLLRADDGTVTGRAAIYIDTPSPSPPGISYGDASAGFVSVGGFVGGAATVAYPALRGRRTRYGYAPGALPVKYVGVLVGTTEDISRTQFKHNVSESALKAWSSSQADLIDQQKLSKFLLMNTCYDILSLDGNPGTLPFCYHKRNFITFSRFISLISSANRVVLPISQSYDNTKSH
jgi:hypothetical protein